ncbi:MAG: hypothetical protein GWN29_07355 [Gammaproteobacteria bacterium]|nr:hypothetical protein [Gammaproteobacteria bacterium]
MYAQYAPRPITFHGLESVGDHRLKVYSIHYGDEPFDRGRFKGAWALIGESLPSADIVTGRPGAGFVILHQAATADYVVLCWWDNENELPTRVFVRGDDGFRPAKAGESFCVWDLRVMWSEREAYVATVLAGHEGGVEEYLAAVGLSEFA